MAGLTEFISQVKTQGLARTNRFSVFIPFPVASNVDARSVLIMCDQVTLPGVNLTTIQQKFWGEVREFPTEAVFENVTFSFYVSNNMGVKTLFEEWLATIRNPKTRAFNYYSNYVTNIQINVHPINSDDDIVHQVTLYEAYPQTLNAVQLDYGSKEVMKYTVSMNYKWYETTKTTIEQAGIDKYLAFNQDPQNINTGTGYETEVGQQGIE